MRSRSCQGYVFQFSSLFSWQKHTWKSSTVSIPVQAFSAPAVEAPRHFVSQVVRLVPHLARLTTKQQSHCRATMQFAHDRDSAQRHRFSNLSSTQSRNSIITSLLCGLRKHSSIASNLEDLQRSVHIHLPCRSVQWLCCTGLILGDTTSGLYNTNLLGSVTSFRRDNPHIYR